MYNAAPIYIRPIYKRAAFFFRASCLHYKEMSMSVREGDVYEKVIASGIAEIYLR